MINKETSSTAGYVVSAKILDVEKRYKPGPKHYVCVYVMQVTWANPSNVFIIYRRYAQFFDLQCKLLDLFAEKPIPSDGKMPVRQIPFLPGKIILGRSQIRQIALERQQALNEYCQTILSLPERISRSRSILEFFRPTGADVQKPTEFTAPEDKSVAKSSLVISEPSELASYRCLAHFTATDKLEMSLKRNDIVQLLQKHENGWWFVQKGDNTGFVPGTFLEPSELQRGAREQKTFEQSSNETYIVMEKYEAKGPDELSLDQGSFVIVLEKSFTGWWTVKFNQITGQFPAICLSLYQGRYTPENVTHFDDAASLNSNDSDWDGEEEDHCSRMELYYAHSDFVGDVESCLSFQRNDLIEIHEKHSSGWWFGRQLKGDHILRWIPANFLQKEPLSEITNENTFQSSVEVPFGSNELNTVPQLSDHRQHDKDQSPVDTTSHTFQGPTTLATTEVIYAEVIKKQKTKMPEKVPSISTTPLSSRHDDDDPMPKSVKELVKRFNQQSV